MKVKTTDGVFKRGIQEWNVPAEVLAVPLKDFSEPWDDAKLYRKYKLTKEEIAFIESMIEPME